MKISVLIITFLLTISLTASAQDTSAIQAYKSGDYEKCLKECEQEMKQGTASIETYYRAACCAALIGDKMHALDLIDSLANRGFSDYDRLSNEPDLKSLYYQTRWTELLVKVKDNPGVSTEQAFTGASEELSKMVAEDQRLRSLPEEEQDWNLIANTDSLHRARVLDIIAEGALTKPDDFFHAALIFQHGTSAQDYGMAHTLSMQGLSLDSTHAGLKQMFALTKDRWLWSMGLPQVYGTQYRVDNSGRWTIEPFDSTAVTDKERLAMGLKKLDYYRKQIKELNGGK